MGKWECAELFIATAFIERAVSVFRKETEAQNA